MQILSRLIWLPFIIIKALSDVWLQKRFLKKHVQPVLDRFKHKNDGSVSDTDILKIMKYYGFGVTAVLSENVATLRNKKLSHNERWASTCQGAITGLFDDFYDKKHLPQDKLLKFILEPEDVKPVDVQAEMFLYFYKECLDRAYDKQEVLDYFLLVNQNQVSSLRQTDPSISYDEMMQTTFDKGGNSVLFYRALLSPKLSSQEKQATYEMGAMMQLANDIFDVFKDSRDGIQTISTTAKHIADVRAVFAKQMDKAFSMYQHIPFSKAGKRRVSLKLLFGITRVFVALDQFEKLEEKSGGEFKPSAYQRADLICDMEKPINMVRSIRYYLRFKIPSA